MDPIGSRLRGVGYTRSRRLLLAVGLGVLLVIALVTYLRRVETVEVVASLLFIPIFVSLLFWYVTGGVGAAILAALAYVALRYPAIDAVGAGRFGGLILSRTIGYLAFGLIGGLASRQLEASLTKLERYDEIDDATGLYNARFLVNDTELEMARSKRYQTIFSVALIDFPAAALASLPRRRRAAGLRELGRAILEGIRTVDRAVHARAGDVHRLAIVLPETAREGARVITDRLAERIADQLSHRGAKLSSADVKRVSLTFPDDEDAIERTRGEFAEIDRAEHPEASLSSEESGGTGP